MLANRLGVDTGPLVGAAVLAPSSHNTQPWLFQLRETGVRLLADRTRALPVNDPEDRELTISCGCALLNLRAAAAAADLGCELSLLTDGNHDDALADVEWQREAPDTDLALLAAAIPLRRTYRKRFEDRPVSDLVLAELDAAATAEGAQLAVLTDPGIRAAVVHLIAHGDATQWADPRWRRELAQWMHPRRRGDGLTVPGLVAPVAQAVVRSFDMGNGVAARDSELAEHSPVLAVLGTADDDPASWLRAGQALQRLLLQACHRGLQASYLNQPIQVSALRPELQRVTGQETVPQVLLRLGYPGDELEPAPRRPIEQVLEA